MFRDDYNNEMNKISPDANTRKAILCELNSNGSKERKRSQNRTKIIWRAATAAVACAVALAVIFIPRTPESSRPHISKAPGNEVLQAVSYNDVYKTLSKIYERSKDDRNIFEKFFDFVTGNKKQDIAVEEYEYTLIEDDMETSVDGAPSDFGTGSAVNSGQQGDVKPGATMEDTDSSDSDYTETNTQVEGVDEADIVKTDGKYIYALYNDKGTSEVRIISVDNGKMKLINTLKLERSDYVGYSEMYLANNRLCLSSNAPYYGSEAKTQMLIIDVTNPAKAENVGVCEQNGTYQDSRLIGNKLYLISNYYINERKVNKDEPSTFVPCIKANGTEHITEAQDIRIYDCDDLEAVYTVVCGYDITDASLIGTQAVLGRCDSVYCSTKNLLTARSCGADSKTGRNYSIITRFAINEGKIEYVTDNRIDGTLLNQFSMDEADDSFRFVTTVSRYKNINVGNGDDVTSTTADTIFVQSVDTSATLCLLDHDLKPLGKIEDLAPGERVYSVRFMGDIAYFVTFRQTDPLFSADLSDPKNPKILGQLKIPGFSNYLFPYGEGQLLGLGMEADEKTGRTECMKLSLFDINDPANVTEHSKYLIEDSSYSEALYNHKASLIDSKRKLIGFACNIDYYSEIHYRIYSCENGFSEVADIQLSRSSGYLTRGIAIGDVLYLVEDFRISSYSLDDFTKIDSLMF